MTSQILKEARAKRFAQAIGFILVVVAAGLAVWLFYSRFRFGEGVVVEVSPSWEKKIAMLRDFLGVLAIFTPLSLVGVSVVSTSDKAGRVSQKPKAVALGLTGFVVLLADVIVLFTSLMSANFGGWDIPLFLFPSALFLLVTGCAFSVFSLAETLA
jgi:hypothetical protein